MDAKNAKYLYPKASEGCERCILHLGLGERDGNILPFTQEKWYNVKRALEKRKQQSSSKYADLCDSLPSDYHHGDGYHSPCYSNFLAIRSGAKKDDSITAVAQQAVLRRSQVSVSVGTKSTTGILEEKCIFCNKKGRIKVGHGLSAHFERLITVVTESFQRTVKQYAELSNDSDFKRNYGSVDLIAREAKYHKSCHRRFFNKTLKLKQGQYYVKRGNAFTKLVKFIKTEILKKGKSETLTNLTKKYLQLLTNEGIENPCGKAQFLCEKLKRHFGSNINVDKQSKKKGIVISANKNYSKQDIIKAAALILRNKIKKSQVNQLKPPITAEVLNEGEMQPPEELVQFYKYMYGEEKTMNERCERYALSSAEDDVYKATNGRIKPAKHLLLGMTLKSLTGSKKVIELLNHFGHCVGYTLCEEYETEIAGQALEREKTTPEGILAEKGLATAIAWDNYDENKDTLSGSGTLHDTQGICFQNKTTELNRSQKQGPSQNKSSNAELPWIRKRSLEIPDTELEPVTKKPKIISFSFKTFDMPSPETLKDVTIRDMVWSIAFADCKDTPMWSGWNSQLTEDPLPAQTVAYMPNIGKPPTRHDVVLDTMKTSLKVADECKEQYINVTYDLGIAKPAAQIQNILAPRFDRLFIHYGPFHIMCRYFGCMGYLIEDSGGPYILTETGVLAPGSLSGFLLGKHYNRCKRLHVLLATALRKKHVELFLDQMKDNVDRHSIIRAMLQNNEKIEYVETTDAFKGIMKDYEKFCEETQNGDHGGTAQFWFLYINLIQRFLLMNRAVKTNDIELFTYALKTMIPVFFACHKPNYSRHMLLYFLKLLNLDYTHPGLRDQLENGAFSVRLCGHSFSRLPVDQAVEMTVNVDAASRMTGISAFTQSLPAQRRWNVTRYVRSQVINYVMEKAGMKYYETVSQELKPYRIQRDHADFIKISETIDLTMNPFQQVEQSNHSLINLSSGKPASDEVRNDLLNTIKKGSEWQKEFLDEMIEDPARFEKPIKRRKVRNFASNAAKSSITTKDKKVVELKCSRDMLGRLLYLSCQKKLDLRKVLSHPLSVVPLSLCNVDGTMTKTSKSKLANHLESMVTAAIEPLNMPTDVSILDGMFLIRMIQNLPSTYGGIARALLTMICKATSNEVHFVCDDYTQSTIKDSVHQIRGDTDTVISITGPSQKRPKDFSKCLSSSQFKDAFLPFLFNEWQSNDYAEVIGTKKVIVAYGKKCYEFSVDSNNSLIRQDSPLYDCDHSEADTRMVFHIFQLHESSDKPLRVKVRCDDTDVMITLLHYCSNVDLQTEIFLEMGHAHNNTRRIVNIRSMVEELSEINGTFCTALPGYHAITGCDYNSCFFGKGKIKPLSVALKYPQFLQALAELGSSASVSSATEAALEEFVCAIYGKKQFQDVNEARRNIFETKFMPRYDARPLEKVKSLEPTSMPPCKAALIQHIKRANFIARMWKLANEFKPVKESPSDHGWKEFSGKIVPYWFEGSQLPDYLEVDRYDNDNDSEDSSLSEDSDSDYSDNENEDFNFM